MFYSMDQYEKAAESLEKALAMSPETHWIHLQLGDTYFYGLIIRYDLRLQSWF